MMRTAILFALLAVIPVWLYAGGDSEPKPPAEQAAQQPQQKAETQPPVQSPKATIPTVLPNGEQPVKPMVPAAPETDPIKLAAPPTPPPAPHQTPPPHDTHRGGTSRPPPCPPPPPNPPQPTSPPPPPPTEPH